MKLETGMYVRTKYGISKIEDLTRWGIYIEDIDLPFEEQEIKSNHNIIDLIEVGDIVTYEVSTYSRVITYKNVTISEDLLNVLKSKDNCKIKSIVTKEQFESMSYKVGD